MPKPDGRIRDGKIGTGICSEIVAAGRVPHCSYNFTRPGSTRRCGGGLCLTKLLYGGNLTDMPGLPYGLAKTSSSGSALGRICGGKLSAAPCDQVLLLYRG